MSGAVFRALAGTALGGYLSLAVATSFLHTYAWMSAAVVMVTCAVSLILVRRSSPSPTHRRPPARDLPVRMVSAAAMVVLLVEIGRLLGPRVAGILSPFSVFAGIMAVSSHILEGAPATHRMMRGFILWSLAFVAFLVAAALTRVSLALAFSAAALAALVVNAVSAWALG